MNLRHAGLLALGLSLGAAAPALARTPQMHTHKVMRGEQVQQRTKRLMKSIAWIGSRTELGVAARKQNKLQFWLQVVGELGGGL